MGKLVLAVFVTAFCTGLLISKVQGSTCQCTCGGAQTMLSGSGGGGDSNGESRFSFQSCKRDHGGECVVPETCGRGGQRAEGTDCHFNPQKNVCCIFTRSSGGGSNAESRSSILTSCKSKGGQCVTAKTCHRGKRAEGTECETNPDKNVCCIFTF